MIDEQERDNWLALFEELKSMKSPIELWAWREGEMELIDQSIMELLSLESDE